MQLDTRSLESSSFCGSCLQYLCFSMIPPVGCPCCIHQHQRGKLRHAFNLPTYLCSDDIVTLPILSICALCQEVKQLKALNKWDLASQQVTNSRGSLM
jgi:Cys-rich protein (TIGR01571 family)